ncbi:MAG: hypothetical protein ACJ8EN_02695, partial [Xanthobacteraceae bacterium]
TLAGMAQGDRTAVVFVKPRIIRGAEDRHQLLRQRFRPSGEVSRQNWPSFDNLVHVPDQPIHMHMEILAYELTSESDPNRTSA